MTSPGRYLPLLEDLDDWQRRARERHPGVIPCRRGCTACCQGPFDISVADAREVRIGFELLDAARQAGIRERALAQIAAMARLEPGWSTPWNIAEIGDVRFDRISDALADEPCPMLEPDGGCAIYRHRPMVCRVMGLGMAGQSGAVLENACPIQDEFPGYAALGPEPFPLEAWEEREAAALADAAADHRWAGGRADFETTIAAVVAAG